MDDTVISIIVPVYNAEKYLGECIGSVLGQTYAAWELILVDDGSTDGSGAICDRYAAQDGRIRVHHRANGGLLSARLAGQSMAGGGIITYLDADDYYDDDAMEKIAEAMRRTQCDCVIFGFRKVHEGIKLNETRESEDRLYTDRREICKKCYFDTRYNTIWRKAYRAEFKTSGLEGLDPPHAEDLLQSVEILHKCRSVYFIKDVIYNYRITPGSLTQSTMRVTDYRHDFTVQERVLDEMRDAGLSEDDLAEFRCAAVRHSLGDIVRRIARSEGTYEEKAAKYRELRESRYWKDFLSKGADIRGTGMERHVMYQLIRMGADRGLLIYCRAERGMRRLRGKLKR